MLLDEFYRICDEILPDEDGCKIWPGARHGRYPRYRIKGREKFWKASRLVLERKLGRPIKPGFLACHRCDYRNCVAEDHIYEGTHKDNMRDMLERNTDLGKAGGKALRE